MNDDLISRQAAIDTNGLDEEIRCEMCKNPMATDRGCDGHCKYDEILYGKIIQILNKRITPLPSAQPKQDREFIRLKLSIDLDGRGYISIIYLEFDDNGVGHEFEGYSSYSLDVISDYLKEYFMPSAQPEKRTEERTETHGVCLDVIDRQAAIDAVIEWYGCEPNDLEYFKKIVEKLPSAQPQYTELTPEEAASEIASGSIMSASYWLDAMIRLKQMGYAICRKKG